MSRPSDVDRSTARSEAGGEATSDGDDDGTADGRPCPLCDAPMTRRHCKYVCPRHGVVYDCSDTFW